MDSELMSVKEAAAWLGVSPLTFYGWLNQSDTGSFVIRGQPVTIAYFQGGRNGQGRIKIEMKEIKRLLDLMKVRPKSKSKRANPAKKSKFVHIKAKLGRPDD